MKSFLYALCFCLGIVNVQAASKYAPVENYSDVQISPRSNTEYSVAEIGQFIEEAAVFCDWEPELIEPGLIKATYHIRRHKAVVFIKFDTKHFNVDYHDSENLRYSVKGSVKKAGGNYNRPGSANNDADQPTIHKNYNVWVAELVRKTQRYLKLK